MENKKELVKDNIVIDQDSYMSWNATIKLFDEHGNFQFENDLKAIETYLKKAIEPNKLSFNSYSDKLDFLLANEYYDPNVFSKYEKSFVIDLYEKALSYEFSFGTFMGAVKFYSIYGLKTFDGKQYLEDYEDRVVCCALFFANGDVYKAYKFLDEIITNRFQPATPIFLNAGKQKRGEYVSCYLLRVEDNMESIARAVTTGLQLSKRGGGVSYCLTNLREFGAPIKNNANQATGIVPVMKILEDVFSYANQLGQRQGAGAVYLNIFHKDILRFLDTKKENADEKVRIKSLSLGIIVPNIAFELAKNNQDMALFSPYEIKKLYGKEMSDISISEKYYELLENPDISKTFISARKLFTLIAELHFESGYPFILYDDTVNENNPFLNNRIVMSNLCSEITQINTKSELKPDLTYETLGQDVACNLGSLNIAKCMENASNFEQTVFYAITGLNEVAYQADLSSAPTIEYGNALSRSIGLGAMNLHGFLATNGIYYASNEAVEFTNLFFYTLAFYAYKASNELAKANNFVFADFENTKYADGTYFDKYTKNDPFEYEPKTQKIKDLIDKYGLKIPTQADWIKLSYEIQRTGLANAFLLAVAPTGSISYLSGCTPSIAPIVSPIEIRKEAKLGRVYVPAYKISQDNFVYYSSSAYDIGYEAIINIASTAQKHVDQAISLTLYFNENATTRDLNKAYIYAFSKKCKSIYYVRIRQAALNDSETLFDCSTCVI